MSCLTLIHIQDVRFVVNTTKLTLSHCNPMTKMNLDRMDGENYNFGTQKVVLRIFAITNVDIVKLGLQILTT
jgi:hypothetical protein